MRSSISRGCRSLGNGNRSAVTGGLGPAHVRRESRGAPRLPSGVCVSSEENTSLPATPPKRAWGGPKNSRSLCGLIWRTLSPLICPTFAATDGVAPGPRPVLVLGSPGSSWWLRRPLLSGGALWRPEAVRLPSRLLRRLRPEIRNADAQASGPGQALLSRFLSHVASSLCVLAPASLAGGPRTGQAPALAGCTPRRPAPRGRGPPPSRAARLPTHDGRSARW